MKKIAYDEARVNLEIDLAKLRSNFKAIQKNVGSRKVMAVLKANAYGLGVLPIAQTLKKAGVAAFGVAELHEALQLLDLGLPIQILGNLLPDEITPAVAFGIVCPVNDPGMAEKIADEAKKQQKKVPCALTIDSGMGRVGMLVDEALPQILEIVKHPELDVIGIYSHFSSAFIANDPYSDFQMARFQKLLAALKKSQIDIPYVHMAASDALNNFPASCKPPFTLVRCGINLYGYYDGSVNQTMNLQSVVELKTRLAAIRTLPAGSAIGYGRMHKLVKAAKVGTIAAGYADGLPLALSNRGYVLIRGRLCPVLGRISMDYTTVLLDDVADAACGDEVVCFGRQGEYAIPVDDWSKLKGTHAYDILCSIGNRVRRVYLNQ